MKIKIDRLVETTYKWGKKWILHAGKNKYDLNRCIGYYSKYDECVATYMITY